MSRILVAYGTRRGSTREVASEIAATLRGHGLIVECRPAGEVDGVRVFDGVVVGGTLYMGRLHPDCRWLLDENREELAALPLAVFAMGPRTLEAHEVESSREQLNHTLAKVPELAPFAVTVFGGVFDPTSAGFPFNRMPASDARDWDAIHAWADEIAAVFATADRAVTV
jgi:menaquinone-dependent protoporphyrinogen oxidase